MYAFALIFVSKLTIAESIRLSTIAAIPAEMLRPAQTTERLKQEPMRLYRIYKANLNANSGHLKAIA